MRVLDIEYSDERGLIEAIEMSKELLKETPLIKERESLRDFLNLVADTSGKVAIGIEESLEAISAMVVEKIIVYEDIDYVYNETPLIEYLLETGIKLQLISKNTAEGVRFIESLGGIGCILKYDWR